MKKNYTFYALILILTAASCKKNNDNQNPGKDLILTAQEQQKVEADNAFTFKLFKEAVSGSSNDKNLMLSPLSVSMAVAMTSNGSNGQTLEAIRNTMEFKSFTEDQVNSYYHKLITELPELDPAKATLKIANSIWYKSSFTPLPAFLKTNADNYNAAVEALDFGSPLAKDRINNWVSSQTNGKIPTIIDQIGGDMVMYLINAVYFKSNWKYKFDKSKTTKGDFNIDASHKIQTDFMTASATLNAFSNQEVAVVELPYGNGKYSMIMALPSNTATAAELANTLTAEKWNTWMAGLHESSAQIKMPKFKFSYAKQLNEGLSNLGMGVAFTNSADFSRINNNVPLKISEVMHKTFIEVNEEGTEAAAVTSVGIELTSSIGPRSIVIDRPFVFAIREMKTGLVLFTGIVNNPLLQE